MSSGSRSRFVSMGLVLACGAGLLVVGVQSVVIRQELAAMRVQVEEKSAEIAALEARCDRLVGGVTEILNTQHVYSNPTMWAAQEIVNSQHASAESEEQLAKSDAELLAAMKSALRQLSQSPPPHIPNTQEKRYEPEPFRNWPLNSNGAAVPKPELESLEPRIADLQRQLDQLRSVPQREEWRRKILDEYRERRKHSEQETFRVIPLPFFPDGK